MSITLERSPKKNTKTLPQVLKKDSMHSNWIGGEILAVLKKQNKRLELMHESEDDFSSLHELNKVVTMKISKDKQEEALEGMLTKINWIN